MWDTFFFVVIGLLVGAAARLCYAGREVKRVLGTMLLGTFGAVLGGLLSRVWWPVVESRVHAGAIVMSLAGALLAIVAWALVAHSRARSFAPDRLK
jgi:uncharacterized membrane protein YeaQ/YmgE (transglycosylase-associated protein family)